jgi:hypothetical protein
VLSENETKALLKNKDWVAGLIFSSSKPKLSILLSFQKRFQDKAKASGVLIRA